MILNVKNALTENQILQQELYQLHLLVRLLLIKSKLCKIQYFFFFLCVCYAMMGHTADCPQNQCLYTNMS